MTSTGLKSIWNTTLLMLQLIWIPAQHCCEGHGVLSGRFTETQCPCTALQRFSLSHKGFTNKPQIHNKERGAQTFHYIHINTWDVLLAAEAALLKGQSINSVSLESVPSEQDVLSWWGGFRGRASPQLSKLRLKRRREEGRDGSSVGQPHESDTQEQGGTKTSQTSASFGVRVSFLS